MQKSERNHPSSQSQLLSLPRWRSRSLGSPPSPPHSSHSSLPLAGGPGPMRAGISFPCGHYHVLSSHIFKDRKSAQGGRFWRLCGYLSRVPPPHSDVTHLVYTHLSHPYPAQRWTHASSPSKGCLPSLMLAFLWTSVRLCTERGTSSWMAITCREQPSTC